MEYLIHIIGFLLIWAAIEDYKRVNKIKIFTKDWLVLFLLIFAAGLLLIHGRDFALFFTNS